MRQPVVPQLEPQVRRPLESRKQPIRKILHARPNNPQNQIGIAIESSKGTRVYYLQTFPHDFQVSDLGIVQALELVF